MASLRINTLHNLRAILLTSLLAGFSSASYALDTDGDAIADEFDNCATLNNPNQTDTDQDGIGNRCDGDFDNNGVVDTADLNALRAGFASANANLDLSGDGVVNFADLNILKSLFGRPLGPAIVPVLNAAPQPLNFGQVFVGAKKSLTLTIANDGRASLNVSGITSGSNAFKLFAPTSFVIPVGGTAREVAVSFEPMQAGAFTSSITVISNTGTALVVPVTGQAVAATESGHINTRTSIDFGAVAAKSIAVQTLTVNNKGPGPLRLNAVAVEGSAFAVKSEPGFNLPLVLGPNQSTNLNLSFAATGGGNLGAVNGAVTLTSDDPTQPLLKVDLKARIQAPVTATNNPVVSARVTSPINSISLTDCANVGGQLEFGNSSESANSATVSLVDQTGNRATSSLIYGSEGGGVVAFSGINACDLKDGTLSLEVDVAAGNEHLPVFVGTPVAKNTSSLTPPVVDPVQPVSVLSSVPVCGVSRTDTTVVINGGANIVSKSLDSTTTRFCFDVPLRRNEQNTLTVTAIDNLAPEPKPIAAAAPISIVHVDPSEIVIAKADSRPLSTVEIATLVNKGVIKLDNPANFNVSMFTLVLNVGSYPVTITQPVVVPVEPGKVSFGSPATPLDFDFTGGSAGGGAIEWDWGWSAINPGTPQDLPDTAPLPPSGCSISCASIVAIRAPNGQVIPGVVIIDGRIKTLKEFFQVTLAIFNSSNNFTFENVQATVRLPSGLTPVRVGIGSDVANVNTFGAEDSLNMGSVAPQSSGIGQFIVRGDSIGTHKVGLEFSGLLTGGGLIQPFVFNGATRTSVQVLGPPTLDVVVRHPRKVGGPDITKNEIYDLVVEITNTSSRPALYTSLELFAGGGVYLVDQNGLPIAGGSRIQSFGHIQPGATASASFRVKSNLEGEILACQAITSENITLTVDTGLEGTACNIVNTLPANVVPLAADLAPVVFGINPLNGQPGIPVTSTVQVILSPVSACLTADTWKNLKVENGFLVDGDVQSQGTVIMEELDGNGDVVGRVAVDLEQESPPAGGTTIVTLRPGLGDNQLRLNPGKQYRVTLKGGSGGICSASSGLEMKNDFVFSFYTAQTCDALDPPRVVSISPSNGAIDQGIKTPIVIQFDKSMDPMTFNPINLWVTQNALEDAGDILSGTPVLGTQIFSYQNRQLTYLPYSDLAAGTRVHVRLLNTVKDTCGNPLQTPPNGVWLAKFTTKSGSGGPVIPPSVNPVPPITNQPTVVISGSAQAQATITIAGATQLVSAQTGSSGQFSLNVPLNLNQTNQLQVRAESGGKQSTPVVLNITQDSIPPEVISIIPADGASGVSRSSAIQVNFSEAINPARVNLLNVELLQGVLPVLGNVSLTSSDQITFTLSQPLEYSTEYQLRLQAGGLQDLAGNGLASEFTSRFTTQPIPIPVISVVSPAAGNQGTSVRVVLTGQNLTTTSALTSPNPGVSAVIESISDTSVRATLTIAADAPLGATSLLLSGSAGSASIPFTIFDKAPIITAIDPYAGAVGTRYNAAIQGTGLANVTNISIDGTGVKIRDLGTGSTTRRNIEIDIASDAPLGNRTITLTTPTGTSTSTFTVVKPNLTPTNIWINPNGGNWNVAANWSKNAVPGINDAVFIASGGVVTISDNRTVNALVLHSKLVVSGNLTLNGVALEKVLDIAVGAEIAITDNAFVIAKADVTVNGAVNIQDNYASGGYAVFQVDGGHTISGDGTINLEGDRTMLRSIAGAMGFGPEIKITGNGGYLSGVIDNAGGLLRVGETGGMVRITETTTLQNLVISPMSHLTAQGDADYFKGASGVLGAGVILNGLLTITDNATVTAKADVTINGTVNIQDNYASGGYAVFQVDGGHTISGGGTINLEGGRTMLRSIAGAMGFGPEIKITGNGGYLSGVIDNAGGLLRVGETGGMVRITETTTLQNLVISPMSHLTAQGDADYFKGASGVFGAGVILNGLLTITDNATVTAKADVTINGTVNIQDNYASGGYAIFQVDGGHTISGDGTINLIGSRTLLRSIAGAMGFGPEIKITGNGGYLSGVIDNAGGLLRVGETGGMVRITETTTLQNLVISPMSHLTAQGDADYFKGASGVFGAGVILNGLLTITDNATVTAKADVTINGTVNIQDNYASGGYAVFQIDGGHTISGSGMINLNGFYTRLEPIAGVMSIGAELKITGNGTLGSAGGTVENYGTIISDTGTLTINGMSNFGVLQANTNRTLNISNFTDNSGQVRIKAGGLVKVIGDYTQTAAGKLSIDVASNASAGKITVTKVAKLAGTLEVQLADGFLASVSGPIEFMTFTSLTGLFDSKLGLAPVFSLNPIITKSLRLNVL